MLNLVKVAVTGGLASGKSTLCRLFEEQGAYVVSADDISHELLFSQTEIIKEVVQLFGERVVIGGHLDRKAIAKIVFNDPHLLLELEKILHPVILKKIEAAYQMVAHKGTYSLFLAEVPLLYEAHFESFFDKVILVTAEERFCKERLLKRSGITKEEYMRRSERFICDKEKSKRADFIINNDGSLEELKRKITSIYSALSLD